MGLSCSTWHLQSSLGHVGSSSLTRGRTQAPAPGAWSLELSHWTTKEVPDFFFLIYLFILIGGQSLHIPVVVPAPHRHGSATGTHVPQIFFFKVRI